MAKRKVLAEDKARLAGLQRCLEGLRYSILRGGATDEIRSGLDEVLVTLRALEVEARKARPVFGGHLGDLVETGIISEKQAGQIQDALQRGL